MKRYRFPLEAILRLRRIEEEQAKERLQQANAALRHRLGVREQELTGYGEVAREAGATTVTGLRNERLLADLGRQRLDLAEQALARAATETAFAQVAYRQAAARVEALERLEARQRAEHDLVQAHEVSSLIDDIVTARYVADHAPKRREVRS